MTSGSTNSSRHTCATRAPPYHPDPTSKGPTCHSADSLQRQQCWYKGRPRSQMKRHCVLKKRHCCRSRGMLDRSPTTLARWTSWDYLCCTITPQPVRDCIDPKIKLSSNVKKKDVMLTGLSASCSSTYGKSSCSLL